MSVDQVDEAQEQKSCDGGQGRQHANQGAEGDAKAVH